VQSKQKGQDYDLRAEILQDVTRCMPENLYFRQPDTQRILLDILFVFCKLNPDVSYRQGMHELLAPVLWVVEHDAVDLGLSSKAMGEDSIIVNVFDPDHIEHDTFALFGEIMQSAKNFYEMSTTSGSENPMVARSQRIFGELLPKVDEELAKHLNSIDVIPQVFLMRWIRLLFGREFSFDAMLTIWDVCFAEDPSLDIVNEICVAMLLLIRWQLIAADYNEALTLLLHYPEVAKDFQPQTLAVDAVYLRKHIDYHSGSHLITKYSGRSIYRTRRPVTPPALQRNNTTVSGVPKVPKGAQASRLSGSARNIEKVFQSTAKELYARSENLGIGKAVRSAVDEVHKRAQEIRDAPTPSPPRPYQQRRSLSTLGPQALQQQIKILENRSKHLARLLESSVAGLRALQHDLAASESQPVTADATPVSDALSVAIAKIQFVQVYLDDPNLDLSTETGGKAGANDSGSGQQLTNSEQMIDPLSEGLKTDDAKHHTADSARSGANSMPTLSLDITRAPKTQIAELADPSAFDDLEPTPNNPATNEPIVNVQTSPDGSGSASFEAEKSSTRPRLDQSSLSWMLDEPNTAAKTVVRPSSAPSKRVRKQDFLFG